MNVHYARLLNGVMTHKCVARGWSA